MMKFTKVIMLLSGVLMLPIISYSQNLSSKYLITYGSSNAKHTIIEYFSFECPGCKLHYLGDFQKIKSEYIESGELQWQFHPYPLSIIDIVAMEILRQLTAEQKQEFMEWMMRRKTQMGSIEHRILQLAYVVAEIYSKDFGDLSNKNYLKQSESFYAALNLSSSSKISDVPSVEINGELHRPFPLYKFIKRKIDELNLTEKKNEKN